MDIKYNINESQIIEKYDIIDYFSFSHILKY